MPSSPMTVPSGVKNNLGGSSFLGCILDAGAERTFLVVAFVVVETTCSIFVVGRGVSGWDGESPNTAPIKTVIETKNDEID